MNRLKIGDKVILTEDIYRLGDKGTICTIIRKDYNEDPTEDLSCPYELSTKNNITYLPFRYKYKKFNVIKVIGGENL